MDLKKPDKRETINLFFSAFLMLAFIVCAQFFSQFAASLSANGKLSTVGQLVTVLVYVVFGLLLFYATRVGDGKVVKRFSPLTLIILVIPSLFIIIASVANIPVISGFVSSNTGTVSVIVALAGVALGYGIPYTFISGFELKTDDEENEADGDEDEEDKEVLEGGVEADILEAQEEEKTEDKDGEEAEKAEETAEDVKKDEK